MRGPLAIMGLLSLSGLAVLSQIYLPLPLFGVIAETYGVSAVYAAALHEEAFVQQLVAARPYEGEGYNALAGFASSRSAPRRSSANSSDLPCNAWAAYGPDRN